MTDRNESKTLIEVSKSTRDRIKQISAINGVTMQRWIENQSFYELAKIIYKDSLPENSFDADEFEMSPKKIRVKIIEQKLREDEKNRKIKVGEIV
jgi:hypothetical protein